MLDNLPFDVLYSIAIYLDIDDLVHLGKTCQSLRGLCSEPTLCRKAVERCAPYALETKLAKAAADTTEQIDYPTVLKDIFDRKMASSRGSPRAAVSFGSVSDFVFNQGVLCYLKGSTITVTDIQQTGKQKKFHISQVLGSLAFEEVAESVSLMHYADGVLSIKYAEPTTEEEYLLIVDLLLKQSATPQRIAAVQLLDSTKLFVRNDRDFVYYGTHSYVGSHGHHEWTILGFALNSTKPFPRRARTLRTNDNKFESCKIQLSDFVGSEIGSTAAFRIHNGFFYAVTNYDDYEVVEIDWTSFYHCFKFPVHDPSRENIQVNNGIYRRQHREGPIHDSWLDLSLQVDEETDELIVVETRKEWLNGSSQAYRTFYLTQLDFSENFNHRGSLPNNDKLVIYANSSSKWAPDQYRQIWQIHPEEFNHKKSRRNKSYILAHTKYRYYNFASNTFIDLVEDTGCCMHNFTHCGRQSCLRLRSGSRRFGPIPKQCHGLEPKELATDIPPQSLDFGFRKPDDVITSADDVKQLYQTGPYSYSKVSVWPDPANVSDEYAESAHDLLSPHIGVDAGSASRGTGLAVQAVADERTIVIHVRASAVDKLGKLVVLSFDRAAKIRSELAYGSGREERGSSSETATTELTGSTPEARSAPKGKQRASMSSVGTEWSGNIDDIPAIEDCDELLNDRIFD